MQRRSAFTLIEVLIAIALMGLVLPALYQSVDVLHTSNRHLYTKIQQSREKSAYVRTLYLDIAGSDGNLSIGKNDFDRLCMEHTTNSLYGLSEAKVCWVVIKKQHTLVRIEGVAYHLPLRENERVEADSVKQGMTLFNIEQKNGKVLVVMQADGEKATAFLVQGITKPKLKKRKGNEKKPLQKLKKAPKKIQKTG